MLPRLFLPLIVIAVAIIMVALEIKAVFAPLVMLWVPGFYLALAIGIWLIWQFHFVVGAVAAGAVNAGFLAAFGGTANAEILLLALFAPALPLAIIQLLILPFRRGRRVTNG